MSDPTAPRADASGVAPIVTHRLTPPGVLPRRGQVWLMVGVAGGILAIILFTGNHDPAPPRAATAPNVASLAPNPDQLRTYQRRLEAADTRPQAPTASLQDLRPTPQAADDRAWREQGVTRPQDAIAEERRRREYESLFANNVVQSPTLSTTEPMRSASPRRSTPGLSAELGAAPPSLDDVAEAVVRASTARTSTTASPATIAPTTSASAPVRSPEFSAADGPAHRILEGTIIDTILINRLDGAAAAPVNCLVSTPIYSTDAQVLVPAGARLLGTTKPVQSFGETRLAVGFTRIVMPNGRTYTLDHFMGLNAIGDAGLRDQVNHHYASTFGVSAAVGLISGFAQYLGGGFVNRNSGPIIITGNVGDATAQAATQTMSRFLNRLPTITVREGHRVKVYLTSDLQLPVYRASPPEPRASNGGKDSAMTFSKRLVALATVAVGLMAGPAQGQLVVNDPLNTAQAIALVQRTISEYQTLVQQYQEIVRMSQGLPGMARYKTVPIAFASHDPSRFPYGAPWLAALNSGDARGDLYTQIARAVQRPNGAALARLPPNVRRAIESAYATIEITDSIAQRGAHQVALVRGYGGSLQSVVQLLETDIVSPGSCAPSTDGHPRQGGGRRAGGPAPGHRVQSIAVACVGAAASASEAPAGHGSGRDEHAVGRDATRS